jgi:hypothetical protein
MEKRELMRYTGRVWEGLEKELNQVKRRATGRLNRRDKHHAADQLLMLCGALKGSAAMAELVKAEHKRSVEWALKNTVSAALVLGCATDMDSAERDALCGRVHNVLPLIDALRLDEAENELRAIEAEMDELRMRVIDQRVGDLLGYAQGGR